MRSVFRHVEARREELATALERAAGERTSILQSLDGKGAFEDLVHLREALGEAAGRAELLRGKLQNAVNLENNKTQLKAQAPN